MLRLTFRLIGFICLALAFAAAIVDGTRSIAAGAPAIMPCTAPVLSAATIAGWVMYTKCGCTPAAWQAMRNGKV